MVHNNSLSSSRIIKNTLFLYAKTFFSSFIILFSTRFVLQGLGEEDYGVFGIVGGVIAMLAYFNIAMSQATQRYLNYSEGGNDVNRISLVFNNTIILHFIVGCIIVVLMIALYYPFFNGIINIPENRIDAAKIVYICLAVSTFVTIITVPYEAMINANEDFIFYSITGVIDAVLKFCAAIYILSYKGDRLILYGILSASISVFILFLMRIYCRFKYTHCELNLRKYASLATVRELGIFAGWNFIGVFSSIAGNFGSTILMNHFFGAIVITAKNLGDQMCGQLNVLSSNMTKALSPSIVKSEGHGDRDSMVNLCHKGCRYGFLLYSVLSIPFIIEMPYILEIWLGEVPEWAVLFCRLQVIRTLLEQITVPLRTAIMAVGDVRLFNLVDLLLGIITFIILYVLYICGYPSYTHYIVSILMLVIASSYFKVCIYSSKCIVSKMRFSRDVLVYPLMSTTVALLLGYILQQMLIVCHLLCFLCVLLETSLLTFCIGLSKHDKEGIIRTYNIFIRRKLTDDL